MLNPFSPLASKFPWSRWSWCVYKVADLFGLRFMTWQISVVTWPLTFQGKIFLILAHISSVYFLNVIWWDKSTCWRRLLLDSWPAGPAGSVSDGLWDQEQHDTSCTFWCQFCLEKNGQKTWFDANERNNAKILVEFQIWCHAFRNDEPSSSPQNEFSVFIYSSLRWRKVSGFFIHKHPRGFAQKQLCIIKWGSEGLIGPFSLSSVFQVHIIPEILN